MHLFISLIGFKDSFYLWSEINKLRITDFYHILNGPSLITCRGNDRLNRPFSGESLFLGLSARRCLDYIDHIGRIRCIEHGKVIGESQLGSVLLQNTETKCMKRSATDSPAPSV